MVIIPHFLDFIALLKARPRLKGLLKITQAILFLKKNHISYVSACLVCAEMVLGEDGG